MADWIKQIKEKDDYEVQKKHQENELRLHRAAVIKAKAPAFWASVVERIEADCKELSETFKDDIRRRCTFARHGAGEIELRGNTTARSILRLKLNLDELGVDQEFFTGEERRAHREMLGFGTDKDDELYLLGVSGHLTAPERISEGLIKKVMRD